MCVCVSVSSPGDSGVNKSLIGWSQEEQLAPTWEDELMQ